jgi:hypothetical protein
VTLDEFNAIPEIRAALSAFKEASEKSTGTITCCFGANGMGRSSFSAGL